MARTLLIFVSILLINSVKHLTFMFFVQAFALLIDYIDREDPTLRIGAIMGLGIAYAGSHKEEVNFSSSLNPSSISAII